MLYTNGDSLLLMLSYILENAVKFTEEGHIILKVRTEKQKGRKMMLFSVEGRLRNWVVPSHSTRLRRQARRSPSVCQ